jgi:hypothetical protein
VPKAVFIGGTHSIGRHRIKGETTVPYRSLTGAFALAATLTLSINGAQAFDETKFPNWKGQWLQLGGLQNPAWDPAKPSGTSQQAPLTPEYHVIFEANIKAEAAGGLAADPTARCVPAGMPRVMMAIEPMEIVITPGATYFMFERLNWLRRIYTDGRRFPDDIDPSFTGYSIGQWQDTDGHGRFDALLIETRAIKGPHTYDASGIPFHKDGEAVVTEKLYTDKADPNILHDEITTTDHALTRPWTVTRSYRRDVRQSQPEWLEIICREDGSRVQVGDQNYKLSPEGLLMPAIKDQKPPNLKYFK